MTWFKLNWVGMLIGAYAAAGCYLGYAVKTAIPAVNVLGAVYVGATWPTWLNGSPIELPLARWMFTIPENKK